MASEIRECFGNFIDPLVTNESLKSLIEIFLKINNENY